jgi:hypothetical protein
VTAARTVLAAWLLLPLLLLAAVSAANGGVSILLPPWIAVIIAVVIVVRRRRPMILERTWLDADGSGLGQPLPVPPGQPVWVDRVQSGGSVESDLRRFGRIIESDLDVFGEPRRLWRSGQFLPTAVYVEVADATPGPDGVRQRYWLRVPPNITTCRAAVAWSFGLTAEEYRPVVET